MKIVENMHVCILGCVEKYKNEFSSDDFFFFGIDYTDPILCFNE